MSTIWGIDVSKYNGTINWSLVKKAGVKFAILRCSSYKYTSEPRGLYKDPYFEKYYEGAKKAGIPVGVYFYSECRTEAEAVTEAKFVLSCIKGKKFEYPIWLDLENQKTLEKTSKAQQTKAVKKCLSVLEKAGYYVGIYTGKYIIEGEINIADLKQYDLWIASYTKECIYKGNHAMWQFGGEVNKLKSTKIPGIGSNVADQNYCYVDYPSIIKKAGLNGYKKTTTTPIIKEDKKVDYVKEIQEHLNKEYNANLKVDGDLGKLTYNAIKKNLK